MDLCSTLRVGTLGLVLLLSSCSLSSRPNLGLSGSTQNLISRFTPEKGEGAVYAVGETARLSLTTRDAGYVTLIALRDDQTAALLLQNARIDKAQNTTFTIPTTPGTQRIRAIFTRERPTTDLILHGIYDGNRWNTATDQWLKAYALTDRDVQETYLYVR